MTPIIRMRRRKNLTELVQENSDANYVNPRERTQNQVERNANKEKTHRKNQPSCPAAWLKSETRKESLARSLA